jgi:hypothetical protein
MERYAYAFILLTILIKEVRGITASKALTFFLDKGLL